MRMRTDNHTAIKRSAMLLAAGSLMMAGGLAAQELGATGGTDQITVTGTVPADLSEMAEGPEIEGFVSARNGQQFEVTAADGTNTRLHLSDATQIRGAGGFLGLNRTQIAADGLLNGLPVTVQTVQWGNSLIASRIRFRSNDMATANMIRNGTAQRFGEHDTRITQNAAATEALRGRMGDIDQYNLKASTNVYFDTGRWQLTPAAQRDLCAIAQQAQGMDNALLLVVGYTDDVGDEDYNQELSERRAGRVVNYLQQQCRWAPYRMLTPTGMAESDPTADNTTPEGRAQNRRVSVNILVSKAVDGLGG
jgi:OOP family OmpA-OmpF porin